LAGRKHLSAQSKYDHRRQYPPYNSIAIPRFIHVKPLHSHLHPTTRRRSKREVCKQRSVLSHPTHISHATRNHIQETVDNIIRDMRHQEIEVDRSLYAAAFLGVAFLAAAFFFGAAFLSATLVFVTRPVLVFLRTVGVSTTAGACSRLVSEVAMVVE
jgi:hypothetical protein